MKLPDLLEMVGRDREIAEIRKGSALLESEKAELEANLNRLRSAHEASSQ
jgi:hypothetical protein